MRISNSTPDFEFWQYWIQQSSTSYWGPGSYLIMRHQLPCGNTRMFRPNVLSAKEKSIPRSFCTVDSHLMLLFPSCEGLMRFCHHTIPVCKACATWSPILCVPVFPMLARIFISSIHSAPFRKFSSDILHAIAPEGKIHTGYPGQIWKMHLRVPWMWIGSDRFQT